MIVYQNFEWDLREAAANLATYGVSFKEAATVFAAENVAVSEDIDSDQLYARGPSARGRTLIVLHTRGARIRILGAMVQQAQAEATTTAGVAPERKEQDGSQGNESARSEPIEDVGARPAEANAYAGTHGEGTPRRRRRRRRRGGSREVVATDAHEHVAEAGAHEAPRRQAAAATETGATATTERTTYAATETRADSTTKTGADSSTETHTDAVTEPRAAVVETIDAIPGAKKAPAHDVALPARHRGRPRRVPREDAPPLALAPSTPPLAAAAPGGRLLGSGLTADEYEVYWAAYSAAREEAKGQGKSLKEAQRIGREAGERAVAPRAPAAAAPVVVAPKPAPKRALSWRAAARAVK